ncbi:SPOR domain-containing protein [Chlorobaculum sp. 24CR]|uniref:SPOR domain-containing protein n=1 Tax=Chlorobaculum sp. 24CR TaxID=2508878 RepID=UPI0014306482|nr:SPOR domain-containing protein [Chlorobaculum sp. 24CR]
MAVETAPDILATLLGTAPDEARRLLDRFAGGLTAELLDRKRFAIDGLGGFSVVHEQSVRKTDSGGTRYQPPRNRVEFASRPKGSGETATIAAARLDMAPDQAQRFAQALSGMVAQLLGSASGFELRGFGSFAVESGKFRFQPDGSLEALLNIGYGELKEIVMPEQAAVESGRSSPERRGMMKPVALFVALSLFVGGWFLYRQFAPPVSDTQPAVVSADTGVPAPVVASVALAEEAPEPEVAVADSPMLGKGRFTVVVATFSSKKSAKLEWQRLSALGHRVRFWPVFSGRDRYYRLVIGDFETRDAALDSMKSMPKGLPTHSYIQQAPKNVVLYGEQGL